MNVRPLLEAVDRHQTVLLEARRLTRDRLAPEFNPFDVLEFESRNEAGLSNVLSWLLDPAGSHGQGGTFLHLFTRQIGSAWPAGRCEEATVTTEKNAFAYGRLDLHVEAIDHVLIIENKPSAPDQPDQIARYLSQIGSKSGCVVYLTENGNLPSAGSIPLELARDEIEKKRLMLMRYSKMRVAHDVDSKAEHQATSVIDWLADCRSACRADRVGTFLDQLRSHLLRRYDGIKDMYDVNEAVKTIKQTPDGITAAFSISSVIGALKKNLPDKVNQEVLILAQHRGWSVEANVCDNKYAGIKVFHPDLENTCFAIQFDGANFSALIFGVAKKCDEHAPDDGVKAALANHAKFMPGAQSHSWWPWYRKCHVKDDILAFPSDWNTPQPWEEIQTGDAAKKIISAASIFYETLESAGIMQRKI